MGNLKFFENMMDNRLKSLHTAYLAKVLSVKGDTAKIQPLGMTKAYGETAKPQSVLSNVPIATQKIKSKNMSIVTNVSLNVDKDGEGNVKSVSANVSKASVDVAQVVPVAAGDIVICVCCERDITEARKGKNSVPALGHHSMSDSVIVGVL